MQEIKLGTIGSGFIVRNILDNVRKTEGIRLAAVYSRREETGRALAEAYGADKVYTDMDAFLGDEEVNLVYIATPNTLHYPQAKKALLAGKNVILEKPFCTRADHARELAALAKERGLFLIDATPTAYLPNLELLRQLLPRIGPVRLVMTNFSQYSSRYDQLLAGELPNNFNPQFAGGCLMDINFYNLHLNVALFGKPKKAVYHPNLHANGIDTSGVLLMEYEGFVSQNAGAKDTWGVNFVQIEGEKGYLYVPNGVSGLEEVHLVTKAGTEVFSAQHNPDRWSYEVEQITRMVREGDHDAAWARLEKTMEVMEVLENARRGAGLTFPGDE